LSGGERNKCVKAEKKEIYRKKCHKTGRLRKFLMHSKSSFLYSHHYESKMPFPIACNH
jgi:hypothetical protein